MLELVRSRVPTLRKEGFVTDRAPTIMRARGQHRRSLGMEIAVSDRIPI